MDEKAFKKEFNAFTDDYNDTANKMTADLQKL